MQAETLELDREKARELYRKYREHQHWSEPIDQEIQRTYRLIAQGRVVIRALASVAAAGVGDDGYPKLALCRADAETCHLSYNSDGGIRMAAKDWVRDSEVRCYFDWPAGTFPTPPSRPAWARRRALVPLVPIHLRPKRGLANYHILFEALWRPEPPVDPMLLRRLGQGDLWVVVAAWDLTPVEQAALAARL
jgi:hypothetical protein